MNNIERAFASLKNDDRRGLIPFITAGDPDLITTRALIKEMAAAGAVAIELGVPFSDPMADGPVIQRASERALEHDFGIAEILDMVSGVRAELSVPLVLFSYYNPLLQFGLERLCREASAAGIDGILVTDLSPEEAGDFSELMAKYDLSLIFLVAPTTTDERLGMIANRGSGFLYAVSRAGVTGMQESVSAEARKLVERVRRRSQLPVAVGFGISSSAQVAEVWSYADAAVVGSAIVAEIEKKGNDAGLVEHVGDYVRSLFPEVE